MQTDLIKAYEEYIELLNAEIAEMTSVVMLRGWKSSRVEQGEQLRAKIKQAKSLPEIKVRVNHCKDTGFDVKKFYYCQTSLEELVYQYYDVFKSAPNLGDLLSAWSSKDPNKGQGSQDIYLYTVTQRKFLILADNNQFVIDIWVDDLT